LDLPPIPLFSEGEEVTKEKKKRGGGLASNSLPYQGRGRKGGERKREKKGGGEVAPR